MGDDAGKWISRVSHQLKRQMLWRNEPDDLTILQKRILHFILFETLKKELFQKDLEEEFKVRRSTATGILQLLEKKGYLYREPVKEDARLKRIVPTDKAVCLRHQLLSAIENAEERIQEGISQEDMEVFMRVLKQISSNLASFEEEKNEEKKTGKDRED